MYPLPPILLPLVYMRPTHWSTALRMTSMMSWLPT
jgi:hypothetical protein